MGPEAKGYYLATASADGRVKLWSNRDFKLVTTMVGHEKQVSSIDVSDDGELLVSSSGDRTWKLWAHISHGSTVKTEDVKVKKEEGVKDEKMKDEKDGSTTTNGDVKIKDEDDEMVVTMTGGATSADAIKIKDEDEPMAPITGEGASSARAIEVMDTDDA